MATINYKDKYEKAVQAAMLAKQDTESAVTIRILEEIFPELAESEDEKIRKAIGYAIGQSTHSDGTLINGVSSEEAVAWLEKKGEQKAVIVPKFRIGDTVRAKTMKDFVFTIKDITDKQYVDTNDGKYDIEGQDYLELVEQKPWSEEDNAMINETLYFINEYQKSNRCKDENGMQNSVSCEHWLKSLKDRVQPKQEWSEEDEKVLHAIRNALNYEKPRNYLKSKDFEFTDILDWLKSLKDRYTWKPSESDIRILEQVINGTVNPINYHALLYAILEQLKKLKE